MNALFEAAKRGDVVALKRALKDPNIDPNFQDTKTGMTALHTATVWRNIACAYELIKNNRINLHLRDFAGRRPVEFALGNARPMLFGLSFIQHRSNENGGFE